MTAFHVLSSAAVAFVIARAGVFEWLRRGRTGWVEFISCPLCVGFWVGFSLGVARLFLWRSGVFERWWQLGALDLVDAVTAGALSGAVALLYTCVIDWLDALEQAAKKAFPAVSDTKPELGAEPKPELGVPAKPQGPDVVLVKEGDDWPKDPPRSP